MSNQTIEGAFGLFKRGVVGSYHRLGIDHLDRYLGEFCWRYNPSRYPANAVQHHARQSGRSQAHAVQGIDQILRYLA